MDTFAQMADRWDRERKVDLVCEGGGVLGIALVGAYSVLEERGYHPQNLVGTSVGAVVATLIAAGYSGNQIHDIIFTDLNVNLLDPQWEERLPLLGQTLIAEGLAILWQEGLYKGDKFLEAIRNYLEQAPQRPIKTFRDLIYDANAAATSPYRYKVQVIVSDVTGRSLLRLPMDAETAFGVSPDDLPVAEAVRMSMSIPFFFQPVRRRNEQSKEDHVLVDGGMLSNYPVWFFDTDDTQGLPAWPTFGLKLVAPSQRTDFAQSLPVPLQGDAGRLVNFIYSLVDTMLQAHDRLAFDADTFVRTIAIPIGNVDASNFALSDAEKAQLYEAGRTAAADFLDHQWLPAEYLATFRSGITPHRRDILRTYMEQHYAQSH
jgi:NTE family protein